MEKQELEKLAALVRIAVSSEDLAKLHKDMESILKYVSQIQDIADVDSEGAEIKPRTPLREDGNPHKSGAYTEELLKEAPQLKDNYVKVKKIISI